VPKAHSPAAPRARARPVITTSGVVVNSVQEYWSGAVQGYTPAQTVLFDGQVQTGCGVADSSVGPFYCPLDHTVNLDPGFFRELAVEFKAPGDFAQAYVLAHELGQRLEGGTQRVRGTTRGLVVHTGHVR
jgi:predicted metalloprotease